jgi:hypothetical protein
MPLEHLESAPPGPAPFHPARAQGQMAALGGQQARGGCAEAGGRAGDEDDGMFGSRDVSWLGSA